MGWVELGGFVNLQLAPSLTHVQVFLTNKPKPPTLENQPNLMGWVGLDWVGFSGSMSWLHTSICMLGSSWSQVWTSILNKARFIYILVYYTTWIVSKLVRDTIFFLLFFYFSCWRSHCISDVCKIGPNKPFFN